MTTPHDWDDDQEFDFFSEAFDDEQDDLGRVDSDLPVQLGLLPDGSALRLTGPGAGSVVQSAPLAGAPVQARLSTRDEALNRTRPLLLVHRDYTRGNVLPRLLGHIVAETNGQVHLGAVTPLPSTAPDSSTTWLANCGAAAVRIADPLGYKLDGSFVPSRVLGDRAIKRYPYLAQDPLNVRDVLDAQRQVGANLLLSPGRGANPADPGNSLRSAFDEADKALSELEPGERLALNLTLPRSWLSQPALRDQLLDYLLDQEQFDIWYIRVQWSSSLRATEQPSELELLQGYKRLAQLAEEEERTLLLPQTGLTGWLQLGFGAAGFGSGMSGADQGFKEPSGGRGNAARIERYFEPALLHAVERIAHDALSQQPGYVPCPCPYCPALHAAADWRHDLSALHQLYWMGRLCADAAAMSRGRAGGAVRRAVRAAIAAAANQPLAGPSDPRRLLSVWDRLL